MYTEGALSENSQAIVLYMHCRPMHFRHLMRTSTEFISWISAPTISTCMDFRDLVKPLREG